MATFPMLIGYTKILPDADPVAFRASRTCPNDGYVFAWQDSTDPLLYWTLPACPVDAVLVLLKAQIPAFVTNRYNSSDAVVDPHVRALDILQRAESDATVWLNEHTTPAIAAHLNDARRLHDLVFTEMKNQGIVQ